MAKSGPAMLAVPALYGCIRKRRTEFPLGACSIRPLTRGKPAPPETILPEICETPLDSSANCTCENESRLSPAFDFHMAWGTMIALDCAPCRHRKSAANELSGVS